jgi:hypothetical protein
MRTRPCSAPGDFAHRGIEWDNDANPRPECYAPILRLAYENIPAMRALQGRGSS